MSHMHNYSRVVRTTASQTSISAAGLKPLSEKTRSFSRPYTKHAPQVRPTFISSAVDEQRR